MLFLQKCVCHTHLAVSLLSPPPACCFLVTSCITRPAQRFFQKLSWEITIITIPKHRADLRAVLQRHWQIHNSRRNLPSMPQPSCLPLPLTHCCLSCQLLTEMTPMRAGREKKHHHSGGMESPNLKGSSPSHLVCAMH